MDARRSQSLNRLPPRLNFIATALLKSPLETRLDGISSKHGMLPGRDIYKTTLEMNGAEYAALKDFFDGSVGHIFSRDTGDSGELLMHFTHRPRKIRCEPLPLATNGAARYLCEVSMEKVR